MSTLPENLALNVATNVLTEIFKSTLQTAEKWITDKRKEHDFFGVAARNYATKLEQLYGMVRILGMEKPISLRDIYVNVNVLEKITERQRISIQELEKFFDRDQRSFGIKRETISGNSVIDRFDRFIVLGKPGAGKTTFLKNIMFQTLDGHTEHKRIPVFVNLKDFSDSGKSLLDYIVNEFNICNFPDARVFVLRLMDQGKFQILLDGLDEVSSEQEESVLREILYLVRKYSTNQFVISCRIAAYNYWFDTFVDVEIADFTDDQISQFISNWFSNEPQTAAQCWRQLRSDPPIKELATIPLLLTLLCLAFNETMGFPKNRADLYKEALDTLLKKWDSSRRIKRSEIYRHFSVKRKESLFSRIAMDTFKQGSYFIPQRTLEKYISNFIGNLPDANEAELEADGEAILKAIEAHHGILVQRAKGIYSFSHLTFQEYFTAQYIVEHAGEGTLESLISQNMITTRWQEVFLLTAGMLENADRYLQLMKKKSDEIAGENGLIPLFDSLQEIVQDERQSPYPSVFVKSIAVVNAFFLAEGGWEYESNYVDGISENSFDRSKKLAVRLLREIERAVPLITDWKQQTSSMKRSSLAELKRALKRAHSDPRKMHFGIKRDLGLKRYELEAYMRSYLLILECLRSECYVSRSIREHLIQGIYSIG
jgi:predicted NACHT family NTPase